MIYTPTTSYASKIDEHDRFASVEEAARYDRKKAISICQNSLRDDYDTVLNGDGADSDLHRAILHLAALIQEVEEAAEAAAPVPTQNAFFKAYEAALQTSPSHRHSRNDARRCAYDARTLICKNNGGHSWDISDAMCTAWRAIGMPGEPTAEKIRALREK